MLKIKPIKPKGLGDTFKRMPKAVEKGMREAADAAKADFEKTTASWEHKPSFTIEEQGAGEYLVGTNDERYKWIDEGTDPYTIRPRGRVLRFSPGSRPKTRPGVITSGGGARGSGVVYTRVVHHPGIKARLFTKQLAARWRRGVAPYVRAALEEANR